MTFLVAFVGAFCGATVGQYLANHVGEPEQPPNVSMKEPV